MLVPTRFARSVFFGLIGLSIARSTFTLAADTQALMNTPMAVENEGWTVSLSRDWDVSHRTDRFKLK